MWVRLNEHLTEPGDWFSPCLQDGTGRDCLEADRLPRSIGQLAGLDQIKGPGDDGRATGGGGGLGAVNRPPPIIAIHGRREPPWLLMQRSKRGRRDARHPRQGRGGRGRRASKKRRFSKTCAAQQQTDSADRRRGALLRCARPGLATASTGAASTPRSREGIQRGPKTVPSGPGVGRRSARGARQRGATQRCRPGTPQ